jgi:Ca2+-binding RTX toxin-like protein
VQNFKNVRGTDNDDIIRGDSQNNTFFGSLGSDILDGTTSGFNTVDYSDLGVDITLAAGGEILKNGGALGTDTIGNQFNQQTIQKIIGATGQTNTIDGTAPKGETVAFDVDLSADSLSINLPFGTVEFEVVGFDNVVGTQNNDTITGNANDNTFFGSEGNDVYNGFAGNNNTVDYSSLDEAIEFLAGGVINKGSNGTDQLLFSPSFEQTIQTVIGAAGLKNVINGSPTMGTMGNAFLNVDLSQNKQMATFINAVGPIPAGTELLFDIFNFVDVVGSSNNDTIIGDANDNTFFGSRGNDILDGAGGFNTVDYSGLNDVITLKVNGVIDKGANGTDQIGGPGFTQTIQKIVGASGRNNTIDGTGSVGDVNFTIDLNSNGLTVNNLFGSGTSATFEVVDFVNVIGTNGRDTIVGNSLKNTLEGGANADTLIGNDGNDVLKGQGGNDFLIGGNGNDDVNGGGGNDILNGVGSELGANDFDILRGGSGADVFVLGEQFGVRYYIGAGSANIADFATGVDKIQLAGAIGQYTFGASNTEIFAINNPGDLIGKTNVAFNTATDFIFV